MILSLCGCLQEGADSKTSAPPTATNPPSSNITVELGFAGIDKVQNMAGNSIKISWLPATGANVVGYRIYEVSSDGTFTAVQQVDVAQMAYIHTGLILGSTHSYLVKAVDRNGNLDPNIVIKSMFTYTGVSSATPTSLNTATVYFNSSPSGTVGANIYYKDNRGGAWIQAGTVGSLANSFNVTGLKSGTTYSFKVYAINASGLEDSNPIIATAQTYSKTFNPPTPQVAQYKGIILAQAYGAASGAPVAPTQRQVKIAWVSFTGIGTNNYSLIRTAKLEPINMTTTTPCTTMTTTSCQVCTVSGAGNQSCIDTNVGAPPVAYDYVVTGQATAGWAEELPNNVSDLSYRVTVPVPPDNMVLVQRDSVNYEMCQWLGKTSDPLRKQRCDVTGASMLGSRPYNTNPGASPLNLSMAYYDFGYDLFVDRWSVACNWTPQAGTYTGQTNNGMCGAGATAGDCFGSGAAPSGTIGVPGNVYYRTDDGNCYYKKPDNTWSSGNSSTLTTAQRLEMMTIDPKAQGGYRPPLVQISQTNSNATCNAVNDQNYGQKRVLRHREFVAAAAWAKFTGETNPMTDTEIGNVEAAAATSPHTPAGGYQCNSLSHKNMSATAFKASNIAGDIGDAVKSFNIGSIETSNCVSRFGIQDLVGNNWEWQSDQMTCSNVTHTCSGTQSAIDSGNGYTNGFDMNGFLFDGYQGPGGTVAGQTSPDYTNDWNLASETYGAAYFNPALGLPLVSNDNGNAVLVSANTAKLHGDYFYLRTDNGTASRGLSAGGYWGNGAVNGRWASYWRAGPSATGNNFGFRCALPAE